MVWFGIFDCKFYYIFGYFLFFSGLGYLCLKINLFYCYVFLEEGFFSYVRIFVVMLLG